MPAPEVTTEDFTRFSGITLTQDESARVLILLGRARRHLADEVDLPDELSTDEAYDWDDAVSELAWLYWEAEKASVMEILSLPVSQLSLGTLFWTKEASAGTGSLHAINRVLSKWGNAKRKRFVLEGELDYPE